MAETFLWNEVVRPSSSGAGRVYLTMEIKCLGSETTTIAISRPMGFLEMLSGVLWNAPNLTV